MRESTSGLEIGKSSQSRRLITRAFQYSRYHPKPSSKKHTSNLVVFFFFVFFCKLEHKTGSKKKPQTNKKGTLTRLKPVVILVPIRKQAHIYNQGCDFTDGWLVAAASGKETTPTITPPPPTTTTGTLSFGRKQETKNENRLCLSYVSNSKRRFF